jgi:hypothetical protein
MHLKPFLNAISIFEIELWKKNIISKYFGVNQTTLRVPPVVRLPSVEKHCII